MSAPKIFASALPSIRPDLSLRVEPGPDQGPQHALPLTLVGMEPRPVNPCLLKPRKCGPKVFDEEGKPWDLRPRQGQEREFGAGRR